MRKLNSKGFTLIELIIVIAIIAILTAVLYPTYTKYIEKSRENVCISNRSSLSREIYIEYTAESYASLEEGFTDLYNHHGGSKICPRGGEYSWDSDSETTGRISCSVHSNLPDVGTPGDGDDGGDTGLGGGSGKYPGTIVTIQDSLWPKDADYESNPDGNITVYPGGIFKHTDGYYYVVTQELSLTKTQAADGPDAYTGWTTFVQKLTGTILNNSNLNSAPEPANHYVVDLKRGDIFEENGLYYVPKDGLGHMLAPSKQPERWYKIPS